MRIEELSFATDCLKLVASNWSKICLKLSEWKSFIDSVTSQGPEFEKLVSVLSLFFSLADVSSVSP